MHRDEKEKDGGALKSFCSRYPKRKAERVKEEDSDGEASTNAQSEKEKYSVSIIDKESREAVTVNNTSTDDADVTSTKDDDITPQVEIVNGEIVVLPSSLYTTRRIESPPKPSTPNSAPP